MEGDAGAAAVGGRVKFARGWGCTHSGAALPALVPFVQAVVPCMALLQVCGFLTGSHAYGLFLCAVGCGSLEDADCFASCPQSHGPCLTASPLTA